MIEPFFVEVIRSCRFPHLGGQRRLVADRRGDAAQEGRHFGARLGEPEDVVDEQEDVLPLLVAEIFRGGEGRQPHPEARARRLVHLAVHEARLLEDLRLLHLEPEVVPLAGALAHAAEHGVAAVLDGDVVDQLHDDDGLADAGAAEQADLAALRVGGEEVDDLDPRLEDLDLGGLLVEGGRGAVDRVADLGRDRAALVDRLADHVHDPAQGLGTDGDHDGLARVDRVHAADQAVGRVHRDAADDVVAQVLGDLDDEVPLLVADARVGDPDRVVERRQLLGLEPDVDHGPDDLHDVSLVHDLPSPPDSERNGETGSLVLTPSTPRRR